MRKYRGSIFLFLILMMILAGCGREAPARRNSTGSPKVPGTVTKPTAVATSAPSMTPTATPTPTSTPTPTPLRAPETFSLEELYENWGDREDIYTVSPEIPFDNAEVSQFAVSGDFVLFTVQETYDYHSMGEPEVTPEVWPECDALYLMHLGRPDLICSMPFPADYSKNCFLLPDGKVLIYDFDKRSMQVYDNMLEPVTEFLLSASAHCVSEDGMIWCLDDNTHEIVQYSVDGTPVKRYSCSPMENFSAYFLTKDGVRYFEAYDHSYNSCVLCIDETAGTAVMQACPTENISTYSELLATSRHRLSFLYDFAGDDPTIILPKKRSQELVMDVKGGYCYTTFMFWDKGDSLSTGEVSADVYNLTDGSGRDQGLSAKELGIYSLRYVGVTGKGSVVFWGDLDERLHLLIWDATSGAFSPVEGFSYLDDSKDKGDRVTELIERIHEQFHVKVLYKKEDLESFLFGYEMKPCDAKSDEFYDALLNVEICLGEYPDGFWEEIPVNDGAELQLYLCHGFSRTSDYSISLAAAVTNIVWWNPCVAFDITYMDVFSSNLAHETMHLMEGRIQRDCKTDLYDCYDYWMYGLNSEAFPYSNSYTDDKGNQIVDYSGTFSVDRENAWYIDDYAHLMPVEDRARTIENLYMGNHYIFETAPHLKAKAVFLCGIIRKAFPSIAACKEPVLWEKTLGIVDFDRTYPTALLELYTQYAKTH